MPTSFARKTARWALVIFILTLCVFFACSCGRNDVTLDVLADGEILPGTTLSVHLEITGKDSKVALYSESAYTLEVTEGAEIASVQEGKVVIAETASAGQTFLLSVTVRDLTVQKRFTVAEGGGSPAVLTQRVEILCADRAEAGETLTLAVVTDPAVSDLPIYTVLSGEGSVTGNTLTVSDRADGGEIVLQATVGGVTSEEKHVTISTIQTTELHLTLSAKKVLPGSSLRVFPVKQPLNSSYPITVSVESGSQIARYDSESGVLSVSESAEMASEIVLVAHSGYCETRESVRVDYPEAQSIQVQGGSIAPGTEKTIEYTLVPARADLSQVSIDLVDGYELVEWNGGATFRVNDDAPQGSEITFLLEIGEEVYTTVTYRVECRTLNSLTIDTLSPTSYLRSGEAVIFTHSTDPDPYDGTITYRIKSGGDLVTVNGNVVTVRDGAGIGEVCVVAEGADGTLSNEVEFTVSGRYSRRVYSNWSNVALSSSGENGCVWMVLPSSQNAGVLTISVPTEVKDLILEGRYDGNEETAYRDLYLYFRSPCSVTLWNFGTVATQGLGGTVMDFCTSGKTEIVLKGKNLIKADTPYRVDTTGDQIDGIWNTGCTYASQEQVRRSGKQGYRGAAGGTAIEGYELCFLGDGELVAVAGNGVNGTAGGKGADAEYGETVLLYLSGSGGAGGHGGDSGYAIHAHRVEFSAGSVTAIPGNAGMGAAGGPAGSLSAVTGRDVQTMAGNDGARGKNGVPYPAVNAQVVVGSRYYSSTGNVVSTDAVYEGVLTSFTDKISRFYGVSVYYGTALENPYAKLSRSKRYTMTQQNDYATLMQQMNFLMYTMSLMPKNCWREVLSRSNNPINIYLCKSITSGTGSNILGLTSDKNRVWFATFATEMRGVYYSGYFNIMLHEFVHVFHYNHGNASTFEAQLKNCNYSNNKHLDYKSSYSATEGVYGVSDKYDESNSCFLSAYSRKTVMEDTSETLSIASTFLSVEPPMRANTTIRRKYDLLVEAFSEEYETLCSFKTGNTLFAYPHLFD